MFRKLSMYLFLCCAVNYVLICCYRWPERQKEVFTKKRIYQSSLVESSIRGTETQSECEQKKKYKTIYRPTTAIPDLGDNAG